ncbi:hypothetical protein BT63DRAFT_426695 [Microthyrium microscopicum]|uniref:Uncharacterized protein n=1 Tax=Microthyrium microscopicum TaxID=703497 RepID=A0A6A6U8S4_9PEZI|nr:hypothetical protein BT63DRAFT_426695 [Microthyrium microscopicum]
MAPLPPPKRGPGRPPKVKKHFGRPRKNPVLAAAVPSTPDSDAAVLPRGRGRPRKTPLLSSTPIPATPTERRAPGRPRKVEIASTLTPPAVVVPTSQRRGPGRPRKTEVEATPEPLAVVVPVVVVDGPVVDETVVRRGPGRPRKTPQLRSASPSDQLQYSPSESPTEEEIILQDRLVSALGVELSDARKSRPIANGQPRLHMNTGLSRINMPEVDLLLPEAPYVSDIWENDAMAKALMRTCPRELVSQECNLKECPYQVHLCKDFSGLESDCDIVMEDSTNITHQKSIEEVQEEGLSVRSDLPVIHALPTCPAVANLALNLTMHEMHLLRDDEVVCDLSNDEEHDRKYGHDHMGIRAMRWAGLYHRNMSVWAENGFQK